MSNDHSDDRNADQEEQKKPVRWKLRSVRPSFPACKARTSPWGCWGPSTYWWWSGSGSTLGTCPAVSWGSCVNQQCTRQRWGDSDRPTVNMQCRDVLLQFMQCRDVLLQSMRAEMYYKQSMQSKVDVQAVPWCAEMDEQAVPWRTGDVGGQAVQSPGGMISGPSNPNSIFYHIPTKPNLIFCHSPTNPNTIFCHRPI